MKEIVDLQARVIAHAPRLAEGAGIDFSRGESCGNMGALSGELRGEINALQDALNAAIPEDFDYFVLIGGDEGPYIGLEFEQMPSGSEGDWDPEQSIFDQLRPLDWDALREKARSGGKKMEEFLSTLDLIGRQLPPAKSLQRDYREELKEFIRERRRDAGKVHVLYLDDQGELVEVDFEDGEAFRTMLPGMVGSGKDVFGIVAHGRPLPVESIDALNAQAQRACKESWVKECEESRDEEAEEAPATETADTEAGNDHLPA